MRKVFKKEVMLTWHVSSGPWKSRCKEKIRHARNVLAKEQEKAGRAPERHAGLIPVGRGGWSRKSLRLPGTSKKGLARPMESPWTKVTHWGNLISLDGAALVLHHAQSLAGSSPQESCP